MFTVQSESQEIDQTSPRPNKDVADLSSEQIDNLLQVKTLFIMWCYNVLTIEQ